MFTALYKTWSCLQLHRHAKEGWRLRTQRNRAKQSTVTAMKCIVTLYPNMIRRYPPFTLKSAKNTRSMLLDVWSILLSNGESQGRKETNDVRRKRTHESGTEYVPPTPSIMKFYNEFVITQHHKPCLFMPYQCCNTLAEKDIGTICTLQNDNVSFSKLLLGSQLFTQNDITAPSESRLHRRTFHADKLYS